jgi:ankyrin repeat protein
LIAEYKADADIRNKICSATLDTAQCGADDDRRDEGKVSLHITTEEGDIDVVKSLLEQGVDINDLNSNKMTLLDRAAAKGEVDVVRLCRYITTSGDTHSFLGHAIIVIPIACVVELLWGHISHTVPQG